MFLSMDCTLKNKDLKKEKKSLSYLKTECHSIVNYTDSIAMLEISNRKKVKCTDFK